MKYDFIEIDGIELKLRYSETDFGCRLCELSAYSQETDYRFIRTLYIYVDVKYNQYFNPNNELLCNEFLKLLSLHYDPICEEFKKEAESEIKNFVTDTLPLDSIPYSED
jgi:hypothetical protein